MGSNYEERQTLFNGYPRGWFIVAFSDELKNGDVHTLNYFGEKFVLIEHYRDADKITAPEQRRGEINLALHSIGRMFSSLINLPKQSQCSKRIALIQ